MLGNEVIAGQIAGAVVLAEAALRETMRGQAVRPGDPELHAYLSRRIGQRREECVLALFLDGRGAFLGEDLFAGDRRAGVTIPTRLVVRRALELDAWRLVLAHNHPSGEPRPSVRDVQTTRELRHLLARIEVTLDDHCVVAGAKVSSMHAMGLI